MGGPRPRPHGPGYAYAAACTNIANAFGGAWGLIPYVPYAAVLLLLYFVIFYYVGTAGTEPVPQETLARWHRNIRYAAYAVPVGFLLHLPWLLVDMGYQRKEFIRALGVLFIAWPLFDFGLPALIIYGSARLSHYFLGTYSAAFLVPGIIIAFVISLGYWTNWNRWREGM